MCAFGRNIQQTRFFMKLTVQDLENALTKYASAEAKTWFYEKRGFASGSEEDLMQMDIAMAMARRKMGSEALPDETLQHWNMADVGRVLMLLDAVKTHGKQMVQRYYSQGDEYEREAILKGLMVLDPEGELVSLAVDACRTNVLTMLSSIAMDNHYPSKFFGQHEFNQMVLKCLFLGFDVSSVAELDKCRNPSMSRMCFDYQRERMAAGRDFPVSIWLTIGILDIPESKSVFLQYLESENPRHRYYASRSIIEQAKKDDALSSLVEEVKAKVNDKDVIALLTNET